MHRYGISVNVSASSGLGLGLGLKFSNTSAKDWPHVVIRKSKAIPIIEYPRCPRRLTCGGCPEPRRAQWKDVKGNQDNSGPTDIINHCFGVVAEICTSSSAKQKENVTQADFTGAEVHFKNSGQAAWQPTIAINHLLTDVTYFLGAFWVCLSVCFTGPLC